MNPDAATSPPEDDSRRLQRAFALAAAFTAVLWVIKLAELALGMDLSPYGVRPRQADGLAGIVFAPLMHGSLAHLFANTAPLLVLGTALFYGYPRAARIAMPVIYLGSGAAVWLFARPAYHLGASGLAFGMLLFIFVIGVLRWDRRAIALALIVSFLYGGMIWGILPGKPGISFEYHLAGALIGTMLAIALRNLDQPPSGKVYDWELQEEDDDEPW